MLGIAVTEIILDEALIETAVGEREPAGMAQHVGVDRPQAGARRSRTNDVVHRLPGERLAALGEEKPWQMVTARSQPASDGAQLVAGDGLLDRETILEPFDPDSCLLQVHLVPTKRDRLADAQTMAVTPPGRRAGCWQPRRPCRRRFGPRLAKVATASAITC